MAKVTRVYKVRKHFMFCKTKLGTHVIPLRNGHPIKDE